LRPVRPGYAFVDIVPQVRVNREDQTVDITYVINESPRVYLERIDIIGNTRTLDRVIRRELDIVEG
jgi:outer membrane protein insertion porin family